MIKFMLMMMIILILMETSTTIGLMETFPSDTKKPSTIILKSSSRNLCNKMKEMHYLSVVLETGIWCIFAGRECLFWF